MPKIVFIQADGRGQTVEAGAGQSLMEAATNKLVPGILGECGGACSCATCHLYVDEAWFDRLPPADEVELAMLEGTLGPRPTSRLGCQVLVKDALDGLVVHVPATQF